MQLKKNSLGCRNLFTCKFSFPRPSEKIERWYFITFVKNTFINIVWVFFRWTGIDIDLDTIRKPGQDEWYVSFSNLKILDFISASQRKMLFVNFHYNLILTFSVFKVFYKHDENSLSCLSRISLFETDSFCTVHYLCVNHPKLVHLVHFATVYGC